MTPIVITDLPAVAVTCIIGHLPWQSKLVLRHAVPEWSSHFKACSSWNHVTFSENRASDRQVQSLRKSFEHCILEFGKYMVNIGLYFRYELGLMGYYMLTAIATKCMNLSKLGLYNTCWTNTSLNALCDIFSKCEKLSSLVIHRPVVPCSGPREKCDTFLLLLKEFKQIQNVKELILTKKYFESQNISKSIWYLTGVRKLRILRESIDEQALCHLSKHGLNELSLFQDEEMPFGDSLVYTNDTWAAVCNNKPAFKCHLLLKNLVILKSNFPSQLPLHSLILVDLATALTKGILDTVVEHYNGTLQVFIYTGSTGRTHVGKDNMEDKRLPYALVNMAHQCSKLHTVLYLAPVSAISVLMIARTRTLSFLGICEECVSLDTDVAWYAGNMDPTDVALLRSLTSSVLIVETEVSRLYGSRWHMFQHQDLLNIAQNYWNCH